jgi:hypothetical protein
LAVICDLGGVDALDPVCATVFAALANHCASRWPTTSVLLCGAQPAVAQVLADLGIPHFLSLYGTLREALDSATDRPEYLPGYGRLPCWPSGPNRTHGRSWALLHLLRWGPSSQTGVMSTRRIRPSLARSAFAGCCFPPEVIVLSVRWYLRFALSYRDVQELLTERGVQVDHTTVYRWVLRRGRPALPPCRRRPMAGR